MTLVREQYDVVVVGAGHAGCEAALACGRRGLQVALVTPNLDRIAWMSCNPSIGGVGKGHLVRELDVLGGAMGRIADATTLHARTLNASKGPAVRATRVQCDMFAYSAAMARELERVGGLALRQGWVEELLVEEGRSVGVRTGLGEELRARAVVVTTGTFLRAVMHVGEQMTPGGRMGDGAAQGLSTSLATLGFPLGRLKTGTCPRLDGRSIDYTHLELQPSEPATPPFAVDGEEVATRHSGRCYITHTTAATHAIIQAAKERSPLFSGQIAGRGPRYCPSIEDKVIRFPEKQRQQVFLEPEGLHSDEVYCAGLSTSLPVDVQVAMVRSIPGLDRARIRRYGYAVEYDFVPPTELWPSLETKRVAGLFLAGQINGTSGYEEAAVQGLMAGLNAALQLVDQPPLVLGRAEAYLGVLIDDLVTRGTDEPYRMFTSRAEHRLLLREDNTAARLLPAAHVAGLSSPQRLERLQSRVAQREQFASRCERATVSPSDDVQRTLAACHSAPLAQAQSLATLLRRPELTEAEVRLLAPALCHGVDDETLRGALTDLRYAGYIAHAAQSRQRELELAAQPLPLDLNYGALASLSTEMREKLTRVRPRDLAQAARIPGVTPAALGILAVELLKRSRQASTTTRA